MNTATRRRLVPLIALASAWLIFAGCEEEFVPNVIIIQGDDAGASADANTALPDADDRSDSDSSPEQAYPAGPYGTGVGDTIADIAFTDHEGAPLSLGDLYRDDSARLLLVSTSAEWCSACREEQPLFQSLYNEYRDRGFRVMVTLFENADFAPANTQDVAQWRDQYNLSFFTVLDVGNSFREFYDVSLTPMNMLVVVDRNAPDPMSVVFLEVGALNEADARTVIELVLDR
jgi:thiol-disulfide isomerase/thioredoxin